MRVQSFSVIHSSDILSQWTQKLKSDIESKGKQYILGVDEDAYKASLESQYYVEPLVIDFDHPHIAQPVAKKEWLTDHFRGDKYESDVYHFTITYKFLGDSSLFRVRPNPYVITSTPLDIEERNKTVSFEFKLYKQDPEEFKRAKDENFQRAFANYTNVNQTAEAWNSGLNGLINSSFGAQKSKFLKENDFFAAINVNVDSSTASVFSVSAVQKKIIPQPTVSKDKEFSSEPTMATIMYDDILKVIYDSGKSMEKKPSLYIGKDEEALRDQFLFVLETRYVGTTVGGETFNRGGKTDIILKFANDGSNLFVAECKFWHGASEFQKAISQLFDRYLTWRDSKVALVLFVKNKEFSAVNETIRTEAKLHPYFLKEIGQRGETSFSYHFRLPQDPLKQVYFEIISFHYDK